MDTSAHGNGMDADTHNLVIELSTRAGMMMEDACAQAISVRAVAPDQLAKHVSALCVAAENSMQLLRSALLLVNR